MANLIIKSSADNLVLQGSDASPAITVAGAGTTTFAENATLSGTGNQITSLGTVTTGVLNSGVTGGTGLDMPKVVWAGWNSASNSTTGSYQDWPLDIHTIAINTAYLTKSANTFTCVKAGTYFVSFMTMSTLDDAEYIHHRMMRSGVHYISTHSYGGTSSQHWQDFGSQSFVALTASQTLTFASYAPAGVNYVWHGGTSYSQLNITYMHA